MALPDFETNHKPTREEIEQKCFSEGAIEYYAEKYPTLGSETIRKTIDGLKDLFDQASIVDVFPSIVENALQKKRAGH